MFEVGKFLSYHMVDGISERMQWLRSPSNKCIFFLNKNSLRFSKQLFNDQEVQPIKVAFMLLMPCQPIGKQIQIIVK